uniref:F-box domain-containing protein n=2 Tax=Caenorhabditis tropicalis TaxID=1561998 RepID=A0A1I7TVU5_9PELO
MVTMGEKGAPASPLLITPKMFCYCRCYRSASVSDSEPLSIPLVPFKPPQVLLKARILHDVDRGQTVEEIDQSICQAYGTTAISFPEVEYWFYWFSQGNREINVERSSQPPLTLSTLPPEILSRILGNLHVGDRMILRRVSQNFKSLSESLAPGCSSIRVVCQNSVVSVWYDGLELRYRKKEEGCRVEHPDACWGYQDKDYLQLALEELGIVMRHPGLKLEGLYLVFYGVRAKKIVIGSMKLFLRHLGHKLHTRELSIKWCDVADVLSIIPFLKPKVLETITVYPNNKESKNLRAIEKLAKLEQWRQAKNLGMMYQLLRQAIYDGPERFEQFSRIDLFHLFTKDEEVRWIEWVLKALPSIEELYFLSFYKFPTFCRTLSLEIAILSDTFDFGHAAYPIWDVQQIYDIQSTRIEDCNYEIAMERVF